MNDIYFTYIVYILITLSSYKLKNDISSSSLVPIPVQINVCKATRPVSLHTDLVSNFAINQQNGF